jgi:hypothetical protein
VHPLVALLAVAFTVSAMRGALAQNSAPAYVAPRVVPPARNLPDWSGVWIDAEKTAPNLFDPSAALRPENRGKQLEKMRDFPPYKPDWEAQYVKRLQDHARGAALDPASSCRPGGMPRVMTTPFPFEFVMDSNRVIILHEVNSQVRRIWTDGRAHPDADTLDSTYNGDSIGHWEGDTLVVDTVGLVDSTVFDLTAAPHSDQMHIVEHIRRVSAQLLQDVIEVRDPVAFTKPWIVTRIYQPKAGWHIMEYVCEDNNRNPQEANGTASFQEK